MGKKFSPMDAIDRRRRYDRVRPSGPVLLVCQECEHRLAKEGRFRQASKLREAVDVCAFNAHASGSTLQLLSVSCLDVCPLGAMAVAKGAVRGRGPAETMVVRTPEELNAICDAMMDPVEPQKEGSHKASDDDAMASSPEA